MDGWIDWLLHFIHSLTCSMQFIACAGFSLSFVSLEGQVEAECDCVCAFGYNEWNVTQQVDDAR